MIKHIFFTIFLLSSHLVFAQNSAPKKPERKKQVDTLGIKQGSNSSKTKYELSQQASMNNVKRLNSVIRHVLRKGEVTKYNNNGILPARSFLYLNAAYLYCTTQKGTCEHILSTVLEIDIINTIIDQEPTCLNMLKFWKSWIDNDMESRLNYKTNITDVHKISNFNRKIRPKYTKCTKTVSEVLQQQKRSKLDKGKFFKQRYKQFVNNTNHVDQTIKMLSRIEDEVPSIYTYADLEHK